MDSWPPSREVEKVKLFKHRVDACLVRAAAIERARETLNLPNEEPYATLHRAALLLAEAVTRGVKGKDPQ